MTVKTKNVAKRLSGTPPEAVPTGLGKNGKSPLALQRRPSQVSAPHPKTKSYATGGTCRVRGCRRHPTLGNSTTAGPIVLKFGVCLENSYLLLLQ